MLTKLDAEKAQDAPPDEALDRFLKPRRSQRTETQVLISPPAKRPNPSSLRRALDLALAIGLLLVAGPFVLLAALAVRLTSRGPAFYTQVRIGLGGHPFTIYKLRTMIDNCESLTGPRWTIPGDPRVTPVGWILRRTHLDELPQLLNILKGEMSLIGPRPERPEFVAELEKVIPGYQRRHAVLPGITGLAQVQLPPDTDVASVRRKLVYDLYFVQAPSLVLDARILVATALHALGVSFKRLHRLGIVPQPERVEQAVADEGAPRLHRQAA